MNNEHSREKFWKKFWKELPNAILVNILFVGPVIGLSVSFLVEVLIAPQDRFAAVLWAAAIGGSVGTIWFWIVSIWER